MSLQLGLECSLSVGLRLHGLHQTLHEHSIVYWWRWRKYRTLRCRGLLFTLILTPRLISPLLAIKSRNTTPTTRSHILFLFRIKEIGRFGKEEKGVFALVLEERKRAEERICRAIWCLFVQFEGFYTEEIHRTSCPKAHPVGGTSSEEIEILEVDLFYWSRWEGLSPVLRKYYDFIAALPSLWRLVDVEELARLEVMSQQTQAQTTAALQVQVQVQVACMQEADMEVYLEEKRASLKRPASAFQRQDKKKKTPVFQQRAVVPARAAAPTPGGGMIAEKPVCTQCGKRHGGEVCWVISGRCLRCGDKNHKIRDCLKMAQQTAAAAAPAAARPAPRAAGRPRAPARVFALARDEAELAEHVTEGTISTEQCFSSLSVCIEEQVLPGNFYLLKMKDYDAILGFDWLEEHYALMD
ncbi:hypothetical protein Taro_006044 [Colocasia esculenta]|uniref:CCHC-type domain-containing protein n=1 Tax=Colocasia esculenta TaxID=4460 RepID=A0A843TRL4_COLES|nr:hypothetical protein [Colocasia esculenta]